MCTCGLLLQHGLPLPQPLPDGEAGDHAVDLGSPLAHVILDVKDKRLLAEVGVHDLPGSLQTHGGVQVGLQDTTGQTQSQRQLLLLQVLGDLVCVQRKCEKDMRANEPVSYREAAQK